MTSTFLNYRFYANDAVKAAQRIAAQPEVKSAQKYYLANIGKVRSVDAFLKDFQLYSYAMKAYGLEDMVGSKAFIRKVLTSDLSDAHSFVNQLSDSRYKDFAKAFGFTAKGAVPDTTAVQSAAQQDDTTGLYAKAQTNALTAIIETKHYTDTIGDVTSADGLVRDPRLLSYVMTAYGLDPSKIPASDVKAALVSDISDRASFANASHNDKLRHLAADFNFSGDGHVANPRLVQNAAALHAMVGAYAAQAGTDKAAQAAAKTESTYVEGVVAKATSLEDLVGDPRVVAFIGKAFGVQKLGAETLRKVLASDVGDPKSLANRMGPAYRSIAAAFDFTAKGTVVREPAAQAQTKSALVATTDAYLQQTMESNAGDQGAGVRLALYFKRKAPTITSAYAILADKALLQVVQTVLNIPASSSKINIDLQAKHITSRIKLSDLRDPVKLNKLVDRFTILYDVNTTGGSSESSSIASLFGG